MNKSEFIQKLKENDLIVTFTKKTTGEVRVLKCTNNIPESIFIKDSFSPPRVDSEERITVYDKEAHEFRTFYLNSIIEVKNDSSQFGLLQE